MKEKENPKQEKAQPKETEKGPKVVGKVELDKNNEVVRPTPKKEAPKAEAPKKEAPMAEMCIRDRGYALESSYRILFNRVSISKDLLSLIHICRR